MQDLAPEDSSGLSRGAAVLDARPKPPVNVDLALELDALPADRVVYRSPLRISNTDVLPHDRPIIVTIDGPAGAGKSSVARTVAARLGLDFLDTGSMYRAAAAIVIDRKIDREDHATIVGHGPRRRPALRLVHRSTTNPSLGPRLDGQSATPM